jgi:predicted kinase
MWLCYKPYMRKWMQDKLKRRKKSAEDQAAGNQPAPLQPAYFEPEPQQTQKSKAAVEPPPEPAPPPQAAAAEISDDAPSGATSQGGSQAGNMRRPRRRRGRGGRGRRSPGQQPSTAAPSVVADSSGPAAAPRAETPRAAKGVVVLAIGLPGSGKSSWFKRNSIKPLSSDMVRALLFDDPAEQRFQDLVFSTLRSMLKARLIAHRPMNYVDATNLTPQERHNWIKLAKDFGYDVHGVFFDVPLEVCIERHQRRDRIVPEDVMRKMSAKLKPPSFDEGFSKITVVKVKQKQEPE